MNGKGLRNNIPLNIEETYRTKTYDGRTVIGFPGYEMVENSEGKFRLIALDGGK